MDKEKTTKIKGLYYLQDEISMLRVTLPEANYMKGRHYHVYCSPNNPGASELMDEVSEKKKVVINKTDNKDELEECEHFLCFLTSKTWTSGEQSAAFAEEVRQAMALKKPVLLAHEMTGFGGQEARFGCEFANFFSCDEGTTPSDLIRNGIYATIAVALKGGEWREPSMVLLVQALANFDHPPPRSDSWILQRASSIAARASVSVEGLKRGVSVDGLKRAGTSFKRAGSSFERHLGAGMRRASSLARYKQGPMAQSTSTESIEEEPVAGAQPQEPAGVACPMRRLNSDGSMSVSIAVVDEVLDSEQVAATEAELAAVRAQTLDSPPAGAGAGVGADDAA